MLRCLWMPLKQMMTSYFRSTLLSFVMPFFFTSQLEVEISCLLHFPALLRLELRTAVGLLGYS